MANKQRSIHSREYAPKVMYSGTASVSVNAQASKAFSPMRNKDIMAAAESGDWSELHNRAERETKAFRRRFYAQKKTKKSLDILIQLCYYEDND